MDEAIIQLVADIGFAAAIAFLVTRAMGNQADALEQLAGALTHIATLASAIEKNNAVLATNIELLTETVRQAEMNAIADRKKVQELRDILPASIVVPLLEKITELHDLMAVYNDYTEQKCNEALIKLDELKELLQ